MIGKFGLDQHFTRLVAAPRAPGHLHDGLRQALRCAEVHAEEPLVRIQDDDQRHVGEIVSLGHHLSAHEDARFARVHAAHGVLHVAALAHGVAVEAHQRRVRKQLRQRFLDAFRALAHGLDANPHCGQRSGNGASAPQ